jgi:hypothetical protein
MRDIADKKVVNATAPTASSNTPDMCLLKEAMAVKYAPSINKGGSSINSISSGSRSMLGKPGTKANPIPPTINKADEGSLLFNEIHFKAIIINMVAMKISNNSELVMMHLRTLIQLRIEPLK